MNMKKMAVLLTFAMFLSPAAAAIAQGSGSNLKSGAVYTMTNADDDNQVVIFDRAGDGSLTLEGAVSTGGIGSGGGLDPLASQGSLTLSHDNRWLLAVNAGSDEISVLRVSPDGLALVDKIASGGDFPVSITIFHDQVYVLNAGETPNITGFYLDHTGQLTLRAESSRELGDGGYSQVGFDPRGNNLVITDRANGEILVFSLDRQGLPALAPVVTTSSGAGPFGFIFDKQEHLLVSEAGSGAVSSYSILPDDSLQVISPSVANDQTATCWIAGNKRGFVYTANTGSQTISAYSVQPGKNEYNSGELTLLNETAGFGNRPIDMDISNNGRYLYLLDPAAEAIDMFAVESDGSLTDLGTISGGLSIFAQGIAVR